MTSMVRKLAQLVALLAPMTLVACAPAADDSEGTGETDSALTGGDPQALEIGFNGPTDQFAYMPKFMQAAKGNSQKKILCHTYVNWKMADEAPGGDASVDGSRAYLADYFKKAQGTCDEITLSFKSLNTNYVPSVDDYKTHMQKWFALDMAKNNGFTGALSFTAWNEPNNGADDGNGIGKKIPADTAARFYLTLAEICTNHNCSVAAGDFASNGNMWNDFESGNGTYLDTYKSTIENEATKHGFNKGFKPHAFAFHGWHDVNEYVDANQKCTNTSDCLVRRLAKGMSGAWASVALWDTETGVGQKKAVNDDEQACGAAFLIRNNTLDQRITRMYVTRLKGGQVSLYDNLTTAHSAVGILAGRKMEAPGHKCK